MAEPWIRVHANLAARPIVMRAADELHISLNEAIGLLVRFWGSMSQHGNNGQVEGVKDITIETWAGWRGKRGRFAEFIRSAHTDNEGRVKEWDDYNGKLEDRRAKDRERKRKSRGQSAGSHAEHPRDVTLMSVPARANETRRDETKRENQVLSSAAEFAIACVVAANQGLREHPDRPQPIARIIGTNASSLEAAEELIAAGVPLAFAEADIYRQAKSHKAQDPVTSLKYFVKGVVRAWKQQGATNDAARRDAPAVNGDPTIAALDRMIAAEKAKEAAGV